jgi:hypothetical protein
MNQPVLLLCGGLQSSGSTLVSWCFLQRQDTDGVLDAFNDILFVFPEPRLAARYHWCKFTIGCFTFRDLRAFYQDAGFQVLPILVVRDVRSVFRSLMTKDYGRNGLTAEDPPLRMRFQRFRRDWEDFQVEGWPIIRFESLLHAPETTLRAACDAIRLDWDSDMLTWPKSAEQVSYFMNGNETFLNNRQQGLAASIHPDMAQIHADGIPVQDLDWLEEVFHDYNIAHEYPLKVPQGDSRSDQPKAVVPHMLYSRRTKALEDFARLQQQYENATAENRGMAQTIGELEERRRQLTEEAAHASQRCEQLRQESLERLAKIEEVERQRVQMIAASEQAAANTARLEQELAQQSKQLSAALALAKQFEDHPLLVQQVEELRRRIERFERHRFLGPAIRWRRKVLGLANSVRQHRAAG